MERYVYQALQTREIRLLDLDPNKYSDELYYTLRHSAVDSGISCEALSYTWGSAEKYFAITCSNRKIPLTENLNAALLRLRNTDKLERCGSTRYV